MGHRRSPSNRANQEIADSGRVGAAAAALGIGRTTFWENRVLRYSDKFKQQPNVLV
jgi:hypothetical protein